METTISLKVFFALQAKGHELERAGQFSDEVWDQYLTDLGFQFPSPYRGSMRKPFMTKPYYSEENNSVTVYDANARDSRWLRIDGETAMRIATLGLP
jgi:hypothetical protein